MTKCARLYCTCVFLDKSFVILLKGNGVDGDDVISVDS